MGLDINLFRKEKGGDPEIIKASEKARNPSNPGPALERIDKIIKLDGEWRTAQYDTEQLVKERGKIQKEIGQKKKAQKGKDPCTELLAQKVEYDKKIEVTSTKADSLKTEVAKLLNKVGNIVDKRVPVHDDEHHNEVVRTWGTPRQLKMSHKKGFCHHHEVLHMIGGYDAKRGAKVAGHRGYFLTGFGALLNMALINYGMQFLYKKKYTPIQTPFFMKKHIMAETAQLSDFEESLYGLKSSEKTDEKEDLYLVATSEQPISAYYRNEWLTEDQLPINFAGFSSCFRKEAGAHGKDVWGIFRVHQFEKIEQFCITEPEKSWEKLEDMCKNSEEFLQSLGLPYRTVKIVSGELNNAAAMKYDIEAWFPGYESFRELVSCQNCTDYQQRALNIRLRDQSDVVKGQARTKKFVHLLNGTLVATERTLCCILENYQEEKGVRVPEVLQPFVGTDFIPYVNECPPIPKELLKAEKAAKKKAAAAAKKK